MVNLPGPTYVVLDGAEIATYVLEPATGTAVGDVVLCHGTPWSAAYWAPIASGLAGEYRVFLWDMPGYGSSIGEAEAPVDLISQRRRFAGLLEHWGVESPHVLAHDIGGAVALGAHLLEGREFASLYLLDIVTLDPWGSPFFRLVAEHTEVFAALPPNLHAALVREYIAGAGGEALDAAWVGRLAQPWCTAAGQRAFYAQIAQLTPEHTAPIVAALDRVRCPVRVGWGSADPWIPVAQADELARRLPGQVNVRRFPGAGHLVPVEAGDALQEDALAWLRGEAGR